MSDETSVEKEMKLLIKIILYLLLSLAFISTYETEYYMFNNKSPIISQYISTLFIFGALILIFAFLTFIFSEKKIHFQGLRLVTYIFVFLFIIILLVLFSSLLSHSLQSIYPHSEPSDSLFYFGKYLSDLLSTSKSAGIAFTLILIIIIIILISKKVRNKL